MKITVVSDLHLEFAELTLENQQSADLLILAGDILLTEKLIRPDSDKGQEFSRFLSRVSQQFKDVIYIAGNHEFYGGNFYGSIDLLAKWCRENYLNVHFLEDQKLELGGVTFLGCSLWTDLNRQDPLTQMHVRSNISDYQAIRNDRNGFRKIVPYDTIERHKKSLNYLKTSLDSINKDQPVVIVTHHSPSQRSITDQFRHDFHINGAFHNRLDDIMEDHDNIRLWVHGHTHACLDYHINKTRVVCNPRGYDSLYHREHTGWNPHMIVEI